MTGYTTTYSGNDITNTLDTLDFTDEKVWSDYDDHYKTRPASIDISLERKTPSEKTWTAVETGVITGAQWKSISFTGLPKTVPSGNDAGKAYDYRITESAVDGYTTTYAQANGKAIITNTLNVLSIRGEKT